MRILIVDDISSNLRLLRALLEGESFEVLEASNGAEGLAVLGNEHVDVVISDILMPRVDGYRFCAAMRRNERFRHVPFIFYTATYTSSSDEKLAFDLGADSYLKKPAPLTEILKAIRASMALPRNRSSSGQLAEVDVLKEYSQTLVAKLEEKCAELSSAVDRYEDLFDNAHDLIFCVKPNGHFLYANRSWRETLGYGATEKPSVTIFDTIYPEFYPRFIETFQRLLAGERMNCIETAFATKSDKPILVDGSASCRKADGEVVALRCIFRDVTERRRAESALEAMDAQVRALAKKSVIAELVNDVSDESE